MLRQVAGTLDIRMRRGCREIGKVFRPRALGAIVAEYRPASRHHRRNHAEEKLVPISKIDVGRPSGGWPEIPPPKSRLTKIGYDAALSY